MTITERLTNLRSRLSSILELPTIQNASARALYDRVTAARDYVGLLADSGLEHSELKDRNNISTRLTEFERQVEQLGSELDNPNNLVVLGFQSNWATGVETSIQNLVTESSSALLFAIARDVQKFKPAELREEYNKLQGQRAELDTHINKTLPKRIKSLEGQVDITVKTLEEKKQEMDTAIASVGIEKYKSEFGTAATKHRRVGNAWLGVIVVLLVATVVAPILIYNNFPLLPSPQGEWLTLDNINRSFIKVVVIFTFLYFISQCIKNYKANRHLQVINEHRSLALLTFTTFVEHAGDDKEVKHAVLLEVTKTIFSPSSTGYAPAENDGPDSKLIEILATLRNK